MVAQKYANEMAIIQGEKYAQDLALVQRKKILKIRYWYREKDAHAHRKRCSASNTDTGKTMLKNAEKRMPNKRHWNRENNVK